MAKINVKITDRTPELFQKLDAAIGRFVRKGIGFMERRIKASMAEPKTGRQYGEHRASAPGESPAIDSGNLVGSIQQIFPSTLEGMVGTNVEYALYLETGTSPPATRKSRSGQQLMGPHRGGMAARPVWEKTRAESLPTLEQMLDAEIAGIGTRV